MYEAEIIPTAQTYTEAFMAHFGLDRIGLTYAMYFDHLEMFQRSKLDYAQAVKTFNEAKQIELQNGVITVQQWQEQLMLFES